MTSLPGRLTRHRGKLAILLALLTLIPASLIEARGRSRGSVRSVNRGGGNSANWSGRRASGTTTRHRSGNTASRTTTARGRGGQTATGNRTVSRDGDTLKVDKDVQTSRGGSVNKSKEYEFDDGRLDSVERDVEAQNRYGQKAKWEGKAEREGHGWEFEGDGKNRYGQKVEAEGYGARGRYGSGAVVDIDGGRYGDRTVVAGRSYRGPAWATTLPHGARPYRYWGRPYYGYGGFYYRPYHYGGVVRYMHIPPPYYVYYPSPPVGAIALVVASTSLLFAEGAYYKETFADGKTQYQVVPAPAGASIPSSQLPQDCARCTVGGVTYTLYGNTFYRQDPGDKEKVVAVAKPAGAITVEKLPAELEPLSVGNTTYFKAGGRTYVSYLTPQGDELYLVTDSPPAADKPAGTPSKGASQASAKPMSVPAGTSLTVRLAKTIDSSTARTGSGFAAHLDRDLVVDGRVLAARGGRVYGRVAETGSGTAGEPVIALEMTGIDVGGTVLALATDTLRTTATGKGSAAPSSGIGAAIDGGDGAAAGAAVAIGAGTALTFKLSKPLEVDII